MVSTGRLRAYGRRPGADPDQVLMKESRSQGTPKAFTTEATEGHRGKPSGRVLRCYSPRQSRVFEGKRPGGSGFQKQKHTF